MLGADRLLYATQKHVTRRSQKPITKPSPNWIAHARTISALDSPQLTFEFGAGKNLAQNLYLSSFIENQVVVDLNFMIDPVEVARKSIEAMQVDLPSKKKRDRRRFARLRHADSCHCFERAGFTLLSEELIHGEKSVDPELEERFVGLPASWKATGAYVVYQKPRSPE